MDHAQQPVRARLRAALFCARWLIVASLAVTVGPHVQGADIKGTVITVDGDVVSGALVSIASVTGRTSTTSCVPYCGRHTVTDADGRFLIPWVASDLAYTIHVEAKDCFPRIITTNMLAGRPLGVTLATTESVPDSSRRQFAGRVLGPDGKPAVGALISGVNPWTVSVDDGRFFIFDEAPSGQLAVTVDFQGVVKDQSFLLMPGILSNTLQLITGTTVSGRVLKGTRPMEGVDVGLVEQMALPGMGPPGGSRNVYEATSGPDGRFKIEHVAPGRDYCLFTKMKSLAADNLAAIKTHFRSAGDGQVTEVAELSLHPAHQVRGRLIFSDNPNLTSDICIVLRRASVPDSQEIHPDEDRTFVFQAVPSESVVVSFHTTGLNRVHGYRLSVHNLSLDERRPTALCGRVDEDLELSVLFEPGVAPASPLRPAVEGRTAAELAALKQAAMVQRQGAQRIVRFNLDPLTERQRVLEESPLRGTSAEVLAKMRSGQQ